MMEDVSRAAQPLIVTRVGLIATDSLPQHNTVSMRLTTNRRIPRLLGAKRFGGVNEVDTTGDVLTGAGKTRWETVRNAIIGGFGPDANGNLWVLLVVSRKYSNMATLPVATVDWQVAQQCVLRLNVSNLDRRKSSTVV